MQAKPNVGVCRRVRRGSDRKSISRTERRNADSEGSTLDNDARDGRRQERMDRVGGQRMKGKKSGSMQRKDQE